MCTNCSLCRLPDILSFSSLRMQEVHLDRWLRKHFVCFFFCQDLLGVLKSFCHVAVTVCRASVFYFGILVVFLEHFYYFTTIFFCCRSVCGQNITWIVFRYNIFFFWVLFAFEGETVQSNVNVSVEFFSLTLPHVLLLLLKSSLKNI